MSNARRRADWSFGPGHGPISGVLNASAGALGITMWAWMFDTSAWWALLVGGCLTAAAAGVAMWFDQAGKVVVFRAVCWGLTGLWAFWVLARWPGWFLFGKWHIMGFWRSPSSPWTWRGMLPLLVGTAVTVFVLWRIDVAEKKEIADREALEAARAAKAAEVAEAERELREPLDEGEAIGDRWEPHLKKITNNEIKIVNVELWASGSGFTLDAQLPADGTVVSDVKRYEEALAASAPEYPETAADGTIVYQGLPDGCGVEIMPNPGLGRRNILIKVTTKSALGADIPYPEERLVAGNIENPIALGVESDFGYATIPVRHERTVLVGNTDSGKSNEGNVVTTELGRCTNELLVGIDLSGNGRFMRPWNQAYHDGKAANPMFRNVAFTEQRARIICASILQMIDSRTRDYAALMRAENKDFLPVSPSVPHITLVVDEFKRLPMDIRNMVEDIVETGRGAAVGTYVCVLEATQNALPKGILTHSRNRIGMRVVDETQLIYLFDTTWKRGRFDPASLPWKGSGLFANGAASPKKFKGFRIDPARVADISIKLSPFRPELDELSLIAGDTVTVIEVGEEGPYEATYSGVWSNWEADTAQMFAGDGDDSAAAGRAAAIAGGSTATLLRKGLNMSVMQTNNPEALAAQGFADLSKAQGNMDDAIAALARQASGEDPIDTSNADDVDGDQGDGDAEGDDPASRTAGAQAGPRTPTAAELAAMFDADTVDEPDRTGSPWSTPPTQPAPPAAVVDPAAAGIPPAGQGVARGGPAPKRRLLQLVYLAGTAGTGPGELHKVLAAEGYPTSLTTVQNTLKGWLVKGVVDQPEGPRTAYFRGPSFPVDRL